MKYLQGYSVYNGLFHGGGFHLLGIQVLACVCCVAYAVLTTVIIIFLLSFFALSNYIVSPSLSPQTTSRDSFLELSGLVCTHCH